MDVSQLPFNKLIGLELASEDNGFLVSLPDGEQYTNHLGTVHGSALLAVAEAGSGAFLLEQFGDVKDFIPVVRKLEAKFRKPATGKVMARCTVSADEIARWNNELTSRGRLSACIPTEVVDAAGTVVLTAVVEWFVARGARNE
jgi:acyl-coenzyme A thioesterase PaaI-like protein